MKLDVLLMLLEGPREDYVIKTYGDKLVNKTGTDNLEQLVDSISEFDPSRNKQYLQWIIKHILNNEIDVNELDQVKDTLIKFEQFKPRLAKKDINQYKFTELANMINQIEAGEATDNTVDSPYTSVENSKVLYHGPYGTLVVPKTGEASCEIGRGTQWCTAAKTSENSFERYNELGDLYIWIDRSGKKYQIWFDVEYLESLEGVDEYEGYDLGWAIQDVLEGPEMVEIRDDKNEQLSVVALNKLLNIPPIKKLVEPHLNSVNSTLKKLVTIEDYREEYPDERRIFLQSAADYMEGNPSLISHDTVKQYMTEVNKELNSGKTKDMYDDMDLMMSASNVLTKTKINGWKQMITSMTTKYADLIREEYRKVTTAKAPAQEDLLKLLTLFIRKFFAGVKHQNESPTPIQPVINVLNDVVGRLLDDERISHNIKHKTRQVYDEFTKLAK